MNILYWLPNFPKFSETFVLNEIRELQRRGHSIAVYSHHSPDELPDDLKDIDRFVAPDPEEFPPTDALANIPWRDLLTRSFYGNGFSSRRPDRHAFALFHAAHGKRFVKDLPYQIDHIHGHFLTPPQVSANYLSTELGVGHTAWGHANDLYVFDDKPTHEFLLKNCDRLFAPSEYNQKVIESLGEITNPPDIDVIPAGFDSSTYSPSDGYVEGRLLTVARHVEKKGIRYALEALAQLPPHLDYEYHIASDGPLTSDLKEYAESLNIADNVSFLGRVSVERLCREYDDSHAFLLPSVVDLDGDRDATPVSIKEAMAMATPVVSTYVGGIPELVTDDTGYLVPPRDVDALAESILTALSTDPTSKGEAGKMAVEHHAMDTTVDSIETAFQEISQRGP